MAIEPEDFFLPTPATPLWRPTQTFAGQSPQSLRSYWSHHSARGLWHADSHTRMLPLLAGMLLSQGLPRASLLQRSPLRTHRMLGPAAFSRDSTQLSGKELLPSLGPPLSKPPNAEPEMFLSERLHCLHVDGEVARVEAHLKHHRDGLILADHKQAEAKVVVFNPLRLVTVPSYGLNGTHAEGDRWMSDTAAEPEPPAKKRWL
eukprot:CAMPEP_0185778528 /NCGR_PEP_ID=MMETSP1174-20130828/92753_1 /TAXON_ID=35687 /ORGANISM="Dictyocha speculum, Strain CCMP1381" /LENGTH=202 /DNA_ID=CAMNT_0028467279 /DNA_START=214 /DNA_END=824 /DNA_ORIENTATION=+